MYDESSDNEGVVSDDLLDTENVLKPKDDIFCNINKMHRKIKVEHHDAIKKLMTSDLAEIIDDPALNQEIKNCREDGNWHKRIVKGERISVRTGLFFVSNVIHKKELQSAYRNIESLRIQTVIKLNKQFDLLKTL